MKITIELTPESMASLTRWAEDFLRQLYKGVPTTGQSQVLTVEEFVAEPKEEKAYTLEQVRAKLTELVRAGKREAVNELIASYGVKCLTDMQVVHYGEVMEKAGKLS